MRILILLAVVLAGAAVGAWATRPGEEAFNEKLRAEIEDVVLNREVEEARDPIAALTLASCKLSINDCYETYRRRLDVKFLPGMFTTTAIVDGPRLDTVCTGRFGGFTCQHPLFGG
ncbi:MAG: hypothetical protein HUJ27_15590 [Rhodobacteraceae bacterium]|nr:hypothetical protein [Paracoccaceae bacterium]